MLARCGIGKMLFYDFDIVALANMNRMFYRPIHVGMSKTEAARTSIAEINPDVDIVSYTFSIFSFS